MNSHMILATRLAVALALTATIVSASASANAASSKFDGSWDLVFSTRSGSCDPSYNFSVNISQGIISHPNLVRLKGNVGKSGAAQATIQVGDKFAQGAGRLSQSSGGGKWRGYDGAGKCSGTWTAQRS